MKAAQYLADYLKANGVQRVFGLPGTESLELVEATRLAGLEFFLTHHEASGAFVASMVGQLTGVPGICLATRGPGAMNLTPGIGAAHLDRMPMIAITGDHAEGPALPTHQRMPLADFFAPITRASFRVSAETLPEQLPIAFSATTAELPGPSFLAFPAPETGKEIDVAPPTAEPRHTDAPLPDLAPALDAIARSQRMVIIAGLGIPNARAGSQLVRLAERLNCPVIDTPQMKGWFPNDHPLYVGLFATHRDQDVTDLANESDLILTIGLDSVEFLKPWRLQAPVVSLAWDGFHDTAIPSQVLVNGPLDRMLAALADEARPAGSWEPGTAQRYRQRIVGNLMPPESDEGRGLLWPQTVVSELQSALPDDGIVTVDVGSHKLLMVLQWRANQPNSFLNSSGISSMGTGIPFAMAAKLVYPERPVCAVIGDGGYLMYTGELATLARTGLPVVVLVLNDASLYSIKIKQLRRDSPPVGTEFAKINLASVAREFGLAAYRVSNRRQCAEAFATALRGDRPAVIEAMIDPTGYDFSQ